LVVEDRKMADIPYICLKQLDQIEKYADIVTVHGISGESLIRELSKRKVGLLPIHTLSVSDNLIDRIYSNKVIDICKGYNSIVGFVSQEKIKNYLTFSPGIKFIEGVDGMGQKYTSVSNSVADVFIVGRGIYESDDLKKTVSEYKEACFKNWH